MDSERDEVRKLIALNEEKNAPVDSATASYMAMAAAAGAGKFDKDDYDRARKQAENNALKRGLRAYYDGRKAGEEKTPWWSPVTTPIVGAWNDSKRIVGNAWEDVKEAPAKLSKLWDATKKWASTFWDETKEIFRDVKEKIWDTPKRIVSNAWEDAIRTVQEKIITPIKDTSYFIASNSEKIQNTLPSVGLTSNRKPFPLVQVSSVLSMGAVFSEQSAISGHRNYRVNLQGKVFGGSLEKLSTFFSLDTNNNPTVGLRYSGPKTINTDRGSVNFGYSAIVRAQWNQGWNASIGIDVNTIDASVEDEGDNLKGNRRAGIFAEVNPWVLAAVPVLVFTPFDELALAFRGGAATIGGEILRRFPQLEPSFFTK